jgi:hypothetical protein
MTKDQPIVRAKNIGYAEVYELMTQSKVVVEKQLFENQTRTIAKQTLLDQSPKGDLIGVEIINVQQKAQDTMSLLLAEINELNKYLVFETDIKGNALRLVNYGDLGNKWYQIKERIRQKYGRSAPIEQLFVDFEKNLALGEESLLEAMQHKGLYGVLFSGIYAFNESPQFESKRVIKNLFGTIDLPLRIRHTTTIMQHGGADIFNITGRGILDEAAFKALEFQRLIRQMRDSFNLKVDLKVEYTEGYAVRQSDGWIQQAMQNLKVEVQGIYLNETKHILTLKKTV